MIRLAAIQVSTIWRLGLPGRDWIWMPTGMELSASPIGMLRPGAPIVASMIAVRRIATRFETYLHQKPHYISDLQLPSSCISIMRPSCADVFWSFRQQPIYQEESTYLFVMSIEQALQQLAVFVRMCRMCSNGLPTSPLSPRWLPTCL